MSLQQLPFRGSKTHGHNTECCFDEALTWPRPKNNLKDVHAHTHTHTIDARPTGRAQHCLLNESRQAVSTKSKKA